MVIEVPEGKRIRKSAKRKETFDESQKQAPEEVRLVWYSMTLPKYVCLLPKVCLFLFILLNGINVELNSAL